MYLLIRPKKGKEPKQRLEELFSSAVSFPLLFTTFFYQEHPTSLGVYIL